MALADIPASVDVTAGGTAVVLDGIGTIAPSATLTVSFTGIDESRRLRKWKRVKRAVTSGVLTFTAGTDALTGSIRLQNNTAAELNLNGVVTLAANAIVDVVSAAMSDARRQRLDRAVTAATAGSALTLVNKATVSPTVTGVLPATGVQAGGTAITITGTNFIPTTVIKLAGTNCTSIVFVSNTTMTAVTPAHAAGAVICLADNGGGHTGSLAAAFTYV